jgi:hypothetical protein
VQRVTLAAHFEHRQCSSFDDVLARVRAATQEERVMRKASLLFVTLVGWSVVSTAFARAPDTFEEAYHQPQIVDSPMWWAAELKLGPYRPDNSQQQSSFGNDRGWLLALEFDITVYHIPYVGQLGVGAGWGWAQYDGKARLADGTKSGETTKLTLYPLSALGVLRIDALARNTVVPVIFAGKIGYDFVRWTTSTGKADDSNGLNKGLRWALQAGLELDFFDHQAARRLDEEWGINHTFLMFEYFDSNTKGTGDRSFTFGLGLQF